MRVRVARSLTASAIVVVLVWCGTGCSRLFDHPVPSEYQRIADQLVLDVEALPGVKSAEAPVYEVDPKDHAGTWYIRLWVRAMSDDGLNVIPVSLAPVLEEARTAELGIDLILEVPGGIGMARSSVGDLSPEILQAVSILRARPEVVEVNGALLPPKIFVTVQGGVSVGQGVAMVRESAVLTGPLALVGLREGSDEASEFSVDVTPTWPSTGLTSALDELISGGADIDANYEVGTTGWAAVNVRTADPARAVAVLESVRPGPEDLRGARFSVRSFAEGSADIEYFDGEVGVTP
jgi:hypothetical protein